MKKIKIESKRHFSAHHSLLGAARNYLLAKQYDERFCSSGHFVALVMSSLAVEALCNTVGELIISDWKDFESSSPKAKIRLICEKLDIPYEKQNEPFQTISWLISFRNKIAHAKPEPLEEVREITEEEYKNILSDDGPEAKIEKDVTVGNAQKAINAIQQMIDLIYERLPEEIRHVVSGDLWEMSMSE